MVYMHAWLCSCMSVLYLISSAYLSACTTVYLHLPTCEFLCLNLSASPSFCLSMSAFISVCLPQRMSLRLSTCPFTHLIVNRPIIRAVISLHHRITRCTVRKSGGGKVDQPSTGLNHRTERVCLLVGDSRSNLAPPRHPNRFLLVAVRTPFMTNGLG